MKKTEPLPTNDERQIPELIGAAVHWGAGQLAKTAAASPAHILDARALMLDSLGFSEYAMLLAKQDSPLPAAVAPCYRDRIRERAAGKPVAYILGWREFYSKRFKTTAAALIPRPDTETLVETALRHLPEDSLSRVLDLGTGCGAIGIVIASLRPRAAVTLTDVSAASIALARENADLHKVKNVRFACGDWYQSLDSGSRFDVIVSNPPYVAEGDEHLSRGDLRFEPAVALVAGADGLAGLKPVICHAPQALHRGGVLLVEHAEKQAAAVRQLFAQAGFCGVRTLTDLAKKPRVTLAVRP